MPNWESYFEKTMMGQEYMKSAFTKSRWMLIKRFLHFSSLPKTDSRGFSSLMSKLSFVYDYLRIKFKSMWIPGDWLTIDEGMIPFKDKCIRISLLNLIKKSDNKAIHSKKTSCYRN
jgi:hypothetical protein